jgi:uncharacterized metal-binding protein YceD (DUF177 family)
VTGGVLVIAADPERAEHRAAHVKRRTVNGEEVTIMNVHLKQIPAEGIHLEGKEPADFLDLNEIQIRPVGPVEYSLDVGLSGSGLFVTGTLGVDVALECVSCLNQFVYPIRLQSFAAQFELTGPELVDLTPWVREDILLALPVHPHCDWDRKTKCAGPRLKYLQVGEDRKAPNAWDALDELNLNRRK